MWVIAAAGARLVLAATLKDDGGGDIVWTSCSGSGRSNEGFGIRDNTGCIGSRFPGSTGYAGMD